MADLNNPSISGTAESDSVVLLFIKEVFTSPLNVGLLCVCAYLLYKIISSRSHNNIRVTPGPVLPPMKKRDFTLEQLREYDGTGQEGRILLAVNGYVYDVTVAKHFYGKGNVDIDVIIFCLIVDYFMSREVVRLKRHLCLVLLIMYS